MEPGTRLKEGVVVAHTKDGVLVGREAELGETLPAGHTEHRFGPLVVFLSKDQAPILPAGLHKATGGTTRTKRRATRKRGR